MSAAPPTSYTLRRGFTLIELLVSITVSSIILAALFQALSQATLSWRTQTQSFSGQRELRSALRLLTDDFNTLLARRTTAGLAAEDQFFLIPDADPFASSRLAFFRASPVLGEVGGEETGDMELVLYAVVLTPSGGASSTGSISTSQKLVRRVFDAQTTMARLENHLTNNTPILSDDDWIYLNGINPGVEVIADNVIRFRVKPMEEQGAALSVLREILPWNENGQNEVIPPWLEVTLSVTHRAAAQQLSSASDWQGRGNHAEYLTNGTPDDPSDDRDAMTLTQQARLQVTP